ncbi:MAG: hypothetical protein RLZZ242_969 [Bacteroidota bacterium]|jgi:3,4-dihydroxy 2-butanone 4-phosphate synthase/GTP cyclohydrolase II
MSSALNTISEAIEAIKNGEIIIVVDDEDRENEGDFVMAAEKVTTEAINFMSKYGRGLICAPLTPSRCEALSLHKMVNDNTDPLKTAFTVSVDLKGNGVTTGISASDRAKTIKALTDATTKPEDLTRPGHIFPLIAKEGGVLRRTGHTEAAIDMAKLAGLSPAGVIVEIMNEDGSMARFDDLIKVKEQFNLKMISIEHLVAYRMMHDSLIERQFSKVIDTIYGPYTLTTYRQTTNDLVHLALTKGEWKRGETVLTRIQPYHAGSAFFNFLKGAEDQSLHRIFKQAQSAEKAALLFINKQPNASDFMGSLNELLESDEKMGARVKSMDEKDFGIGAQILHDLNLISLKLLSNSSPIHRVGLSGYGLHIEGVQGY